MRTLFITSFLLSGTLFYNVPLAHARFEWTAPVHVTRQMETWHQQVATEALLKPQAKCAEVTEIQNTILCQSPTHSDLNMAFLRASIFVEGGSGITPGTVIAIHDQRFNDQFATIRGHDLKAKDLLKFYRALHRACEKTRQSDFCPTPEEKDLYEQAILPVSKHMKKFVMISFAGDDSDWHEVVSHEVFHAQFFMQKEYEDVIRNFWLNEVSTQDKDGVRTILAPDYNRSDEYLMMNEFQAYLLESGAEKNDLARWVPLYRDALLKKLKNAGVPPLEVL